MIYSRLTILVAAAFLLVACGDEVEEDSSNANDEEMSEQDLGAICFNVDSPWEPGSYSADSPVSIRVFTAQDMISGCATDIAAECEVSEDGDAIHIESTTTYQESSDEECDGEAYLTTTCGDLTLEAKTYDVVHGDQTYEVSIPGNDDVDEAGPNGPEWSDCVGFGEEMTVEDDGNLCVGDTTEDETSLEANEAFSLSVVHEVGGSSCVDDFQFECEITGSDSTYTITTTGSYRDTSSDDGECTNDVWEVTAACDDLSLDDGTYTFIHGDDEYEVEIPSQSATCPSPSDAG